MTELDIYRRFGLPLLYWPRVGDDPKEWKGPHQKGWNDPARVYDFKHYRPDRDNVGAFTGREIAPGRYLTDVDVDKLNTAFVLAFFPGTSFALTRAPKELSHLFFTTPTALKGKIEYLALSDDKPYVELRGAGLQTMLAPSLHTPPDIRVALLAAKDIAHVKTLDALSAATLDYSIASLVVEAFPGGLHHDTRLPLAGYLLKRQFDDTRVRRLLQTICTYQVARRTPDMSQYDVDDAGAIVTSTLARLKHGEPVAGGKLLREINADFVKRLQTYLPRSQGPVGVEDFYAYMPNHSYLFIPSREFWPASSVNARIAPIVTGTNEEGEDESVAANTWLDRNRSVEQLTWAPGLPLQVRDRLVADGGWIDRPGCSCVNLYRAPTIALGDAKLAGRWLELVTLVYPDDADHLVAWFAHRVQRPQEKINHALVLGGVPGIGKDSILEPVKTAVGPWNFAEVSPTVLLGRFNGFLKSVILRVSEVRDLGDVSRYAFYEHMKPYTASPPDVLRVDEKNVAEHAVFNVCGPIHTTNHESNGMYLPADDRRHYVTWSRLTPADFPDGYWQSLYDWYDAGGRRHVAAYLASYDLSKFDAKAPPKKTDAFWVIVDANRPAEDAELADAIDALSKPDKNAPEELLRPRAITLTSLVGVCDVGLGDWLKDRKSSRLIPHRMKTAGYVPYRNPDAKDGLWKIDGSRQVVYVDEKLSVKDRQAAALEVVKLKGEVGGNPLGM